MSRDASSPLWALFATELRMLARDKRTLVASILLPLLVMPLFFFISSLGERQRQERIASQVFQFAIIGAEAEAARSLLDLAEAEEKAEDGEASQESAIELSEVAIELEPAVEVEGQGNSGGPAARALAEQEVHVILEALSAEQAAAVDAERMADAATREENGAASGEGEAAFRLELPRLRLLFLADWDASNTAVGELEARLERALLRNQDAQLTAAGFRLERGELAQVVEARDVATAAERTGASLGRYTSLFLMLFLIIGGSVVAADTLAGEKERGTLETVLTTAAGRGEIIGAKLLAIFAVGLLITLIQIVNLGVYAGLRVIDVPADFAVDLSPVKLFWLVFLFVPFALLVSATLLWVSGRSPTYKAFQIALLPLMLLLVAPTAAAFLPGMDLRSVIAVVPLAGAAVAVREILSGQVDWPFLVLTWLSSAGAAALITRACLKDLSSERLVMAVDRDEASHFGGAALLERRVLRYFAFGWALIFLAALSLGLGLRGQILFNVVGVFFGGSILLIRRYRLDPREVLALRPVCPTVWAGVLLGAPATFFLSVAIGRLSGWLFPLPEEALKNLGQSILPEGMPLWQLLFFVSILPGICEEVAFRGVLLHSLRRRFGPVSLVLVTAAIFAVFHVEWVRLLPTFALGIFLAVLTWLTGSLLPAIVWHILNNASAILVQRAGLDMASLPTSSYLWATGVAILAWVLIWRGRSPYPDRSAPKPSHGTTT